MAQILERRSRVVLAAALAVCTWVGGRKAMADDDLEGVRVELGVTGGYEWFAKNLELGVNDDPTLPSPKSSVTFGIRAALVLSSMFAIEGEALGMPTKDNQLGNSLFLDSLRIHLRYSIVIPGPVTPFVLAGIGNTTVLSTKGDGSYTAIKKDTDTDFHFGVGVKYAFTDRLHLRLDGRIIAAPNVKKDGYSPDYEATIGFGVVLGGHHPAAPLPVVQLQKDTDGDGITDDLDKCPNEAGPKENDGCPDKDSDGDGIVDRKDKCPDKAGPPERDGCPEEDRDHDGIVDSKDKCPDDAEDKDGFEDADGCPDPDNDKDGIPDVSDKCPNEPETKNGYQDEDGCPDEVPVAVKAFTGVVKGINFRRNSADIKASSFPLLKQAISVFKSYPALRVEISGHTSTEGKREFNMKLSRKRAEAVKAFLVSAGIDESRVGTIGYGPDKPIADNDSKDGQEKNRRIEFRLLSASEKIQTQPEPEDINPSPERKHKGGGKAKAGPGKADKADKADKAADKATKAADKADKVADKATKATDKADTAASKADKAADKADKPKAKKKAVAPGPDDEPMPK
jgi:outer membrane protein OmpA-like peptidoglycan-associated protein/opacity protein-like surface antigen